MMGLRNYSGQEWENEEAKRINAEQWQLDALKRNPAYTAWGIHEDYMIGAQGWAAPQEFPDWQAFAGWKLDDLNELVNFYFAIDRDSITCPDCDGSGYNPETHEISEAFYDFDGKGTRWCENITQDEVDALIDQGRLWDFKENPVASAVNTAQRKGMVHDAINRSILIETRAKRLGVYGHCDECGGNGEIFTAPRARLTLMLWFLHPRKGASRGVEVQSIQQDELPAALEYLREAARRNAERFSKLD